MKKYLCLLLLILFCSTGYAQEKRLSGKVVDVADGSPAVGASIAVLASDKTVLAYGVCDINGNYSVGVPKDGKMISVSFIGYETQEVMIENRSVIDISLKTSAIVMDEIVVTALNINRAAKSLNYARQAINSEVLSEIQAGDFVSSLSGKVAGVSVTPAGVSNGTSRIVIRGTRSLTENSMPVFVVDGMIIENQPGDDSFSVDGGSGNLDMGNPAADINPEDIESIEILKGPNAAALYGSRAANGVVLITTKKANAKEKIKISYDGNFQFERIAQLMEYQNGWGTGENNFKLENSSYTLPINGTRTNETIPNLSGYNDKAGAKLRSWGAPLWDQPIYGHDGEATTHSSHPDNVRDFYSLAHRYANSFSIEGGSKDNNYRLSYTNVSSNSVVKGINQLNKNTFSVRLFNTLAKWMTLDSKLSYSREKVDNRQYMNGSDRNPIYAFVTLPRDITINTLMHYKDANGNEMIPIGERGYNPYWNVYENTNSDIRSRITGSANLEIKFLPSLKWVSKAGVDSYSWTGTEFANLGARSDLDGSMENWHTNYLATDFSTMLMFDKRLGDLSITAFGGASLYTRDSDKYTQAIGSLLVAGFKNISNSGEYPTATQNLSKKQIQSVYGSVSLGYKGFLFLDATARNDWSSTLPIDNCSYFYPSVGATFIFSDAFKMNPAFLSFGKLRASLAYAGADTSPYRTSQTFAYSGIYNGQPLQTISTTLNNTNLLPERTRSLEIGTDLRFLKGRLGLDLSYYKTDSYDLITSVTLSTSSGYSKRYLNAGHIQNNGVEVVLSATPIERKNFTWDVSLNWARNRSQVLKVASDGSTRVAILTSSNVTLNLEEGRPYGVMRGRVWKTDDQGRKLVDASGKPLVTDNTQEMGCVEPDWTGSITNTFSIHGFSVNLLFDARIGGVLYSGTWNRATTAGVVAETAEKREEYYLSSVILCETANKATTGFQWEDAYFEDGSKCEMYVNPRYRFGSWDSRNVFDASYIKLRELSVGYTLPSKLLTKAPVKGIRFSVVGRNLAILYQNTPKGIDPEAAVSSGNAQGIEYGGMPPVATFGFDIKLTF